MQLTENPIQKDGMNGLCMQKADVVYGAKEFLDFANKMMLVFIM